MEEEQVTKGNTIRKGGYKQTIREDVRELGMGREGAGAEKDEGEETREEEDEREA